MIGIIAIESKTVREFARRAEAFNATEADPMTDGELAAWWPSESAREHMKVVRAIRQARRDRVSKRQAMWGALIADVGVGVES